MKFFKLVFCMIMLAISSSCSNVNDKMMKMIPSDSKGVICVKTPEIIKKAELVKNGEYVLPAQLKKIIESHKSSVFCAVASDLSNSGFDYEHNIYVFLTDRVFKTVALFPLDDESKAMATLEKVTDNGSTEISGVKYINNQDTYYVAKNGVLLVGTLNKLTDPKSAVAEAVRILDQEKTSITDNDDVKKCLNDEGELNAYLDVKGLNALLSKNKRYQQLAQKMPIIGIFTESDIKALVCNLKIDKSTASVSAKIKVDDNSDYVKLLTTTLGKPSGDFLKVIPNSMEYIVSMSINGANFSKLAQMQQITNAFKKVPNMAQLDLSGIVSTINGPLAIGLARDPYLHGEWNMVIAAKAQNPDLILGNIIRYAQSMGQAPEKYDSEYVYQYNNKQVNVGVNGDVVYVKMLDYEQTEGYAYELPDVRDFFAKSPIGIFVHSKLDSTSGFFNFGITNYVDGSGFFYTQNETDNAALVLLEILCDAQGNDGQNSAEEDVDLNELTGAGDFMQSMSD